MKHSIQSQASALSRLGALSHSLKLPPADVTVHVDGHVVDVSTSRTPAPDVAARRWADALGLAVEELMTEMTAGRPGLLVQARGHANNFAFLIQGRVAKVGSPV